METGVRAKESEEELNRAVSWGAVSYYHLKSFVGVLGEGGGEDT